MPTAPRDVKDAAMTTIREDELTQCIEALERAKYITDHKHYHSDTVGSVHDRLADLIAECQAELRSCDSRPNTMNRLRATSAGEG